MASVLNMSLEEIIRKNRKGNLRSKGPGPNAAQRTNKFMRKAVPTNKAPLFDARNKIISKKRTQLTDAREKLLELSKQKDARLKLEQLRQNRHGMIASQERNIFQNYIKLMKPVRKQHERVFLDQSRQVVSQPFLHRPVPQVAQMNVKRFLESRDIDLISSDNMRKMTPILRTVKNDLGIYDDPMGDEYVPPRPSTNTKTPNLKLRIVARNNDDVREKDRPSRNFNTNHRLSTPEKSPPRPPSILKKRPMAALRTEKNTDKKDRTATEYRIIVSNLGSNVTGGDIEELFGDVGGMVESRLVRPGTAEVIYKSLEDAQSAVDLYHNRQLDGQPMNCLLVTPRATAAPSRSNTSKPALISSNSTVEPDISTFHKVLFSNM